MTGKGKIANRKIDYCGKEYFLNKIDKYDNPETIIVFCVIFTAIC